MGAWQAGYRLQAPGLELMATRSSGRGAWGVGFEPRSA